MADFPYGHTISHTGHIIQSLCLSMTASPTVLTVSAALDGLSFFLIANHAPHRQSHDAKKNHTNNCCSHNRLLSDKQTHRLTDVLEKSFVPVGKCARA